VDVLSIVIMDYSEGSPPRGECKVTLDMVD